MLEKSSPLNYLAFHQKIVFPPSVVGKKRIKDGERDIGKRKTVKMIFNYHKAAASMDQMLFHEHSNYETNFVQSLRKSYIF